MVGRLRVGNGAGFWGDDRDAPGRLARAGRLDALTLEYLAELTMAILAHLRSKSPTMGYVSDFPETLAELAADLACPRVVTNAGGLNPHALAARCGQVLCAAGRPDATIAALAGDDILDRLPGWIEGGEPFAHLETGQPLELVADRLVAANAYLGAGAIASAYAEGADLIVTGRVADASLTLGPAVAAFGWSWDDWDRLAAATVAGHLIECGAQATGGLWHDWEHVDFTDIGYPIAELGADGSVVVTKPDGTGGLVTPANVAEQLVYEIDDPARYRTPDLDVDLTGVELRADGPDRVRVVGAIGRPPSDFLKVSAIYRDGWSASGTLAYVGQGAEARARAAGRILIDRVERAGRLAETLVEVLGAGDLVPGVLRPAASPTEVVLRVSARDPSRAAIERFCRAFAPLVLAGPPGVAGYATGRPEPRPAFGYWPTLVPRGRIKATSMTQSARDWAERTL